MERDPCMEALGIHAILGEILMRVGCTKSLFRSTLVNKSWLCTVRSKAVLAGFTRRNKPSLLGFMAECRLFEGDVVKLLEPAGAPSNSAALSMRAWFDARSLRHAYVLGSHGGRVIVRNESPVGVYRGICLKCPYARQGGLTPVAGPVPPIDRIPEQFTANTYGQFAVLLPSDLIGSVPVGFFVRDAAGFFDKDVGWVRFNSDSKAHVHVRIHRNKRWKQIVSEPYTPPAGALFHRNPYCVATKSMVYMMYLLAFIVCVNPEEESFGVVPLPGEMAESVKSAFDYTVGPHAEADLTVVHADNGILVKWVLVRKGDSVDWHIETSVDLVDAFSEVLRNGCILSLIDGPLNWSSVQVRRICSEGRFVFISIGLKQALFVIDMVEKRATEVFNVVRHGLLGRVFPLYENWPPMEPMEVEKQRV